MIILVSPAKKIKQKSLELHVNTTVPYFEDESEILISCLKKYNVTEIEKLMKISPALADLNFQRYLTWQKPFKHDVAGPAVFMFDGDVYRGLNVETFNKIQLEFTQNHLRILSGLHGVLRPMDLILPYRLEMGTKLPVAKTKNLYQFWTDKITQFINNELNKTENNFILNLASEEYFKSVNTKLLNGKLIKAVFKEVKNGKFKIISFYAKRARGLMARYIIENNITDYQSLKSFNLEKYSFNEEMSSENELVFTR